jgi:uncharacterized membrane protein YgdD (TMEM256/DUF423 family)
MHKGSLKAGAALGALSVCLGAFAAHILKEKISADAYGIFQTGVQYQFLHAFALLLTGMLYKEFASRNTVWAGRFFIAGIILFCGSLYGLCYAKATGAGGLGWLGPVTPLGGAAFIAGWLSLLSAFFKKPAPRTPFS